MSSLRHLRTERVHADETALLQIKTRLDRVQRQHDATQALLAETQRAADELAVELIELRGMEQQTAARLAQGRASLVQECISALPDDVLRCLFEEAAGDNPFVVAAVCGRWRRVALAFPAMWSTIRVPIPPSSAADIESGRCEQFMAAQLQRVNHLLERSRSAPLDVHLSWTGFACQGTMYLYCFRMFHSVASEAARWRTVVIGLPYLLGRSTLDFLRGPTPLLVELDVRVSLADPAFDQPQSGYLPYAPRLQKLWLNGGRMGCAASSDFRNLTDLCLKNNGCTDDQLFQYLRITAATIYNLTIASTTTRALTGTLALPRLRGLHIGHTSFPFASPSLVLPSLTVLSLCPNPSRDPQDMLASVTLSDALIPFLEAVSHTVKKLFIGYHITDECLSTVAHLKNIELLGFYPNANYFAEPALGRLVNNRPPIWPRLAGIENLLWPDGGGYEGILGLIAARNTHNGGAVDQDAARPCKLQQVFFAKGAPEWLIAEVARLLKL